MTDDELQQNPGGAVTDTGQGDSEAPDGPAGDAPPQDAPAIQALREELDRCHDRLLRKTAEFDNYRKRTDRERREQADRTVSDLLLELVAIIDDFDRALNADVNRDSVEAYRQGVELIHRQILELLKRRNVRPIDAVGADFDPHLHQAVTTETAEGRREGEVVEELRRGYLIGERLLRPSMVKVART